MTDSLQKKLSSLRLLKDVLPETDYVRLREALEAVRSCASSIQRDIDKRKDNTKVKYSDFPIPNFGFRSYWKGYLEAKEEDKKLLVGSSTTSKEGET